MSNNTRKLGSKKCFKDRMVGTVRYWVNSVNWWVLFAYVMTFFSGLFVGSWSTMIFHQEMINDLLLRMG